MAYMRSFEKSILLIISFMICAILFFCLGIERGKHQALVKVNSKLDLASKEVSPSKKTLVEYKVFSAAIDNMKSIKEDGNSLAKEETKFTIQVASFKTTNDAEKEATALQKKGFTAIVLTKGSYSIVCVGNFNNKNPAASMMLKLKGTYRDCFIRRL